MKELLLAKSNLRKGKTLAIGLILLITMVTCFLNVVLLIFLDFQKDPYRHIERLNTEDAMVLIKGYNNYDNINEEYINGLINKDEINDFEIDKRLYAYLELKYGDGTITPDIVFETEKQENERKIGKSEIILEDETVKENYIYLPYGFHTGGKIELGEIYEIKILDKEYKLKVKGFIDNIGLGSYNSGGITIIVDDDTYNSLHDDFKESIETTLVKFDLKDGVDYRKFINKVNKSIALDYPEYYVETYEIETVILGRTFISLILGVSFLVVSAISIVIVLLMLSNDISNYIKENIKMIGAIKAIGYTSKNIRLSFLMQFILLALIGGILGIAISYIVMPMVADIMVCQTGIPYTVKFNLACLLITVIGVLLIIALTVLLFTRKIKKIEPIVALRDGINTHNFKKNRVKLEKSILPLNVSLALKTMFTNMKQNIATFIIVFFLVFSGVIALFMYQNFSVDPMVSIFTFEICNGSVEVSESCVADTDKIVDFMKDIKEVKNLRLVTSFSLESGDDRIYSHFLDNTDNLKNKDVCYKGRLPKYDNEVAISGKYAKVNNYAIGDEIELGKGDVKEKYIITGYIQTTNNLGQEAVMQLDGVKRIVGDNYTRRFYFDVDDTKNTDLVLNKVKDKFGDKVTTANYDEIMKGAMGTFITISNSMVIVMMSISFVVILLVLYLLMKTLINNKKKDYGILKAVGYKSSNIIFQNAVSFMPTIILSVIISSIVSGIIANPYIETIMSLFGVMKLNFAVPVNLIIIMAIGFIIVSALIASVLSLRIRKIEPYNLLNNEN